MEISTEMKEMLDLMLRPAFYVADGIIRHINPSAAALMLCEGQPISAVICTGGEEYDNFTQGCLHLDIRIAGKPMAATVIRRDGGDIFLPESPVSPAQFQILSLAAAQLREPLAGLMAITDQILPDTDPKQAALANRRLHQLLRMIGNMSDVQRLSDPDSCRMEYTDICAFLEELLEKAQSLLSRSGVRICSQIPRDSIYTLMDREQMERAIYNLLSNAAKYSNADTSIQVELSRHGQRLYLSVQSNSAYQNPIPVGNYYSRYLREPLLEDPAQGLGLGIVLIRAAASNHGGAVLIDQPEGQGTRITMSLAIRQGKSNVVRSPVLMIDYTGERDHALIELADVLPPELYTVE